MLPNYQARSPFVLKHTTSYVLVAFFALSYRGGYGDTS